MSNAASTFLIVKLSSLGDVIQTIPVVADLLAKLPNAQIDWVVEQAFAPLLSRVKGIRTVIPIAQRRWRKQGLKRWLDDNTRREQAAFFQQLRRCEYDGVIDAHGLIKSGLVTRRARLKQQAHPDVAALRQSKSAFRVTFGNRSEACGYEWPVRWCTDVHVPMPQRIHAVSRTRYLSAMALSTGDEAAIAQATALINQPPTYAWQALQRPVPVVLDLYGQAIAKKCPAVLLVHGSSRSDNAWPLPYWRELCAALDDQGFAVWLPHSNADELHQAQAIAHEQHHAQVLARGDLAFMADVIDQAYGVIGLDTGLSHWAIAVDKPCLQIFLHDRAWRAGPFTQAPLAKPYQQSTGHSQDTQASAVIELWQSVCESVRESVCESTKQAHGQA